MKALLFLIASLCVALADRKYDIAKGIAGTNVVGKKEGHEGLVEMASDVTIPVISNMNALIDGVQYHDMPDEGTPLDEGLNIVDPSRSLDVVRFTVKFVYAEKAGILDSIVAQTHFGCLQLWHAMSPINTTPQMLKKDPGLITLVYTNEDVGKLIVNSMTNMWKKAVERIKEKRYDISDWLIGRISHTIGDSYAQGHTYRGKIIYEDKELKKPTSVDKFLKLTPANTPFENFFCGSIKVYQDYGGQKGNSKHGDMDHGWKTMDSTAPNFKEIYPMYTCAKDKTIKLFRAYRDCKNSNKCDIPTALFQEIFYPDPKFKNALAGGALDGFQGPTATACETRGSGDDVHKVCFEPFSGVQNNVRRGDASKSSCDPKAYLQTGDLTFAKTYLSKPVFLEINDGSTHVKKSSKLSKLNKIIKE